MTPFEKYYIIPAAVDEFSNARIWYASQGVNGLSNRFSQSVKITILKILKHPTAYSIRYKGVRIAHTEKFPYAIHFTLTKSLLL